MEKTVYIHYGCEKYDESKFDPIKNAMFVKPKGGLWGTRIDSNNSWKQWCEGKYTHRKNTLL